MSRDIAQRMGSTGALAVPAAVPTPDMGKPPSGPARKTGDATSDTTPREATSASGTAATGTDATQMAVIQLSLLNPRDTLDGGSQGGLGDGAPPPPGAPGLSAPNPAFSAADIAMLVQMLMAQMDDAQSTSEQQGLMLDDTQRKEANQRANAKIAEAAEKIQAAMKKQKALGALAVVGKVLAGVGAVALTIATGGLAAPLAVAVITYTVVDTTLTVADSISQAEGGPRLDLNDLMTEGFSKALKGCGVDDQKADEAGKWMAFGVQMAVTVVAIASSIATMVSAAGAVAGTVEAAADTGEAIANAGEAAADTGEAIANAGEAAADTGEGLAKAADATADTTKALADAGETTSEVAEDVADAADEAAEAAAASGKTGAMANQLSTATFKALKITSIASQGIGGATQMTSGALTIAVGFDNKHAEEAQADKAALSAQAARMDEIIRNTLNRLEEITNDLSMGMKTTAEIVSEIGQTNLSLLGGTGQMV